MLLSSSIKRFIKGRHFKVVLLENLGGRSLKDMVTETVLEKIERFKLRAELFLREKTKAFIIDTRDDWHFCYITEIGEDKVEVIEFTGKLAGQKNFINWVDILKFEEFREEGG